MQNTLTWKEVATCCALGIMWEGVMTHLSRTYREEWSIGKSKGTSSDCMEATIQWPGVRPILQVDHRVACSPSARKLGRLGMNRLYEIALGYWPCWRCKKAFVLIFRGPCGPLLRSETIYPGHSTPARIGRPYPESRKVSCCPKNRIGSTRRKSV